MSAAEATQRFYALVWPHRAAVLRSARIVAGDATEADDLAQETLIKAFKGLSRFQDGTDMRAWLTTILRNAHVDRLRAAGAGRRDISLADLPGDPADASDEIPGPWESPQDLMGAFGDLEVIAALQELPEEIRWTLLLTDVEGLSQTDASELLQVPVGTIKSRAHRGRAMLKKALLPLARDRRLTSE